MDNRSKRHFETARPIPAALERTPEVIDWEQLDAQEQSAVQRSQHAAMEAFDEWSQHREEAPSQAPQATTSPWLTGPWQRLSLAGCALLLLFGGGWLAFAPGSAPSRAWPSLQTQGHAKLQWHDHQATRQLQVDIPAARAAQLADPGRWSLDAQGGSRLTLRRQERQRLQIQLQRGSLVAHVTPKTMKSFVVRCQHHFDVVVKGTVFAIRQGPGWLRVEVFHGRVEVKRKRDTAAVVNAGEGVRFRQGHTSPRRYRVFQQTGRPLTALLRWMRSQAPQELIWYARDIASQSSWSRSRRRTILELSANLLGRQRHHTHASRLWKQLYDWQPKGFEGQTALFQAAQQCRKGQPKGAQCIALHRTWLKQFPEGIKHLHEACMYGLIQLLDRRLQRRRRDALIKRYLRRHPSGLHRRSVLRLRR